jgi:superfamily II helicase
MKAISILSLVLLTSCSFFEKPQLRKYSVKYWSVNNDESYAVNDLQAYTLIERDAEKLIFLVKGKWTDTLFIEGKKVNGILHSLLVNQSHLFQFNGEITEQKYHVLKIEGITKMINGPGGDAHYTIQ